MSSISQVNPVAEYQNIAEVPQSKDKGTSIWNGLNETQQKAPSLAKKKVRDMSDEDIAYALELLAPAINFLDEISNRKKETT